MNWIYYTILILSLITLILTIFSKKNKKELYQPKQLPKPIVGVTEERKASLELIQELPEDIVDYVIIPQIPFDELRKIYLLGGKFSKIIDRYTQRFLGLPFFEVFNVPKGFIFITNKFQEEDKTIGLPIYPSEKLTKISYNILKNILDFLKPQPYYKKITNENPSPQNPEWIILNFKDSVNITNDITKFNEKIQNRVANVIVYLSGGSGFEDNFILKVWINNETNNGINDENTETLRQFCLQQLGFLVNLRKAYLLDTGVIRQNVNGGDVFHFKLLLNLLKGSEAYQNFVDFKLNRQMVKERDEGKFEEEEEEEEKEEKKEYPPVTDEEVEKFINHLGNSSEEELKEFIEVAKNIKTRTENEDAVIERLRYLDIMSIYLKIGEPQISNPRGRSKDFITLRADLFPSNIIDEYNYYFDRLRSRFR